MKHPAQRRVKHPGSSSVGGRAARARAVRVLLGLGMVAALVVGASGTALSVPPPPVNPSDDEIAGAQAQVESGIGLVGTLINQVADADQQLARLDDEVATRREDVNKALVDLQAARSAADAAAAAVEASRAALRDAGAAIDLAQSDFDAYARSSYMHGTNVSSLSAYLGADGPDAVLDRAQVLQILSASRGAVLDQLQRARTEEANRDSHARAAKADADAAAAEAENKRAAAEQAIATARAALDAQATRRAEIAASRAQAQEQLDSARASAAGLDGQRQAYRTWDEQRQAEEAAQAAAAAAARQAAEQAASRVAADAAARELAAQLAQTQNSHTDLDTYTPTPKTSTTKPTPTVTGSEAIETVVDRGMSQIGVEYAWGGGDENGPTKGIRDGGVADSYGDFDKIGFDCSGLMIYAFAGIGISLPHYTGYQYTAGEQVPSAEMRRGDMIFYGPNASQHVALYLGDGEMLEAPQSGSTVRVSPVRWEGMTPYAVRMVE